MAQSRFLESPPAAGMRTRRQDVYDATRARMKEMRSVRSRLVANIPALPRIRNRPISNPKSRTDDSSGHYIPRKTVDRIGLAQTGR